MFYFIRHAQSKFNFEADIELRDKMGEKFSKFSQEYKELKFDPKYFDCDITQQGIDQCKVAK